MKKENTKKDPFDNRGVGQIFFNKQSIVSEWVDEWFSLHWRIGNKYKTSSCMCVKDVCVCVCVCVCLYG